MTATPCQTEFSSRPQWSRGEAAELLGRHGKTRNELDRAESAPLFATHRDGPWFLTACVRALLWSALAEPQADSRDEFTQLAYDYLTDDVDVLRGFARYAGSAGA